MTSYELLVIGDRLLGYCAFGVALLLAVGYSRVIFDRSQLVRDISTSNLLFATVGGIEGLIVKPSEDWIHLSGIGLSCATFYAAYRGLRAMHQMIPPEERDQWSWWSAPAYPPWAWMRAVRRIAQAKRMDKDRESDPP